MSEHQPAKRVAAFDAVVSLAIEEAGSDSGRYWGTDVDRSDVEKRVRRNSDVEVSVRTIDRALQDAAALGWLESKRKGWDVGDRAEQVAGSEEKQV